MPLTLTPQLSLSERYIENSNPNINNRSEDFISSAIASLQLNYQFTHGHLGTNLSFESDYSTQTYLVNRFNTNQFGNLEYIYEERRWSAGINGSVISTRIGETVPQNNQGILTTGTEYHQETVGVLGNYFLTRKLSVSGNYTYANNEYSSDAYVDSESHSISSSLGYQLTPSDQYALLGGANVFRYKPGSTFKSVTANAQWTHKIGQTTSFMAATGVGVTTGRNLIWLADLKFTKNFETGSFQTEISRNFATGGGVTDTAVVTQQLTISASRQFSRAFSGNISGSVGDSVGVSADSNSHTKFWNASAGLSYAVASWLNSVLAFSHYYQQIEGRFSDLLYSDQVLLTFSSNFTPWRPF